MSISLSFNAFVNCPHEASRSAVILTIVLITSCGRAVDAAKRQRVVSQSARLHRKKGKKKQGIQRFEEDHRVSSKIAANKTGAHCNNNTGV